MDAVRERCLSDEAAPAPGGWEALGARMRLAAARRRAAFAAAAGVAGVVAALFLWAPWQPDRHPDSSGGIPPEPPASLLSETFAAPDLPANDALSFAGSTGESHPAQSAVPSSKTAQFVDGGLENPAPSTKMAQNVDGEPKNLAPSTKQADIVDGVPDQVRDEEREPKPRHRARISSVNLRVGSSPVRRNAPISMASAPYLAALNFLNTTDPSLMPRVKSNTNNTQAISAAANAFFPESSAGHYTHDLPLSLGLSLRMELTPKIGLETGLEYTYLHSVEEFAGSRLNQRLHFVGIPVRLDASLWTNGGFGVYAGVGAKVEKCVSATLGRVACEEPRLQWSAEAFGGIQYQLSSRTHLYFQPALSWYFTKTDLPSYRTEHPLGVTLHAGLRFDL